MKPIDRAFIIRRLALLARDFDERTDEEVARELAYLAITAKRDAVNDYFKDYETYMVVQTKRAEMRDEQNASKE